MVSIPLLLDLLGKERYAAYALVVSLMGWFGLLDMGFGNSLQNFVSEGRATGNNTDGYLAAGGLMAIGLLIVGSLGIILLAPILAKFLFVKMPFLSQQQGIHLIRISGVLFLANSLGTIGNKILYANQKGYIANGLTAGAALAGLGSLLWVLSSKLEDKLLWSLVAYAMPLALTGIGTTAFIVGSRVKNWHLARKALPSLIKRAWGFWLFALMATGVLSVDYLVMSQTLTPHEIATYSIITKVFVVSISFYTSLLQASWPVCAELIIKGEWGQVKKTVRIYIIFGFGGIGLITLVLASAMPWVFRILAPGQNLTVSLLTLILLAIYYASRVWSDTYAMVLQSMSDTTIFIRWVPVQAILSLVGQIILVKILGLNGIIIGLILSFVGTVVWVLPYRVKYWSRRQQLEPSGGNIWA